MNTPVYFRQAVVDLYWTQHEKHHIQTPLWKMDTNPSLEKPQKYGFSAFLSD